MEKLVENLVRFLSGLYPEYDVVVRHEHRTWRITKPTILISVGESRYVPITIGYGSVKEENTLTISVIHPSNPGAMREAFERAYRDIVRVMNEVMKCPEMGDYILVVLENTVFAETLRNPGIAIASCNIVAMRIISRR